jgi:single-strand DNA-binding protein
MNKVTLVGFVEREPELRRAADGRAVASFTVSTSRDWTTGSGIDGSATEWFNVVAWGALAEAAKARLIKNQRLYAEGHLQTRIWDDSEGRRQACTEVVASELIPLDTREPVAAQSLEPGDEDLPLCLNKIIVIGNLGRNPEMRYTPDGRAVTSFSMAATRSGASASGVHNGATEWFNVVAWGSLAEICNQHLAKGRRVCVEGELRTRGWEQPAGEKRFRTELIAHEMIMLGPRPKDRSAEQELTE